MTEIPEQAEPSSGCVWRDILLPCQTSDCEVCDQSMTEATLQERLRGLLEDTTDICVVYADYIREHASAVDIERHPYLPELEELIADCRDALAAAGRADCQMTASTAIERAFKEGVRLGSSVAGKPITEPTLSAAWAEYQREQSTMETAVENAKTVMVGPNGGPYVAVPAKTAVTQEMIEAGRTAEAATQWVNLVGYYTAIYEAMRAVDPAYPRDNLHGPVVTDLPTCPECHGPLEHEPDCGVAKTELISRSLRDARNTLVKTATCRIDGEDIVLQRVFFDSVVRNLDAALAQIGGEA